MTLVIPISAPLILDNVTGIFPPGSEANRDVIFGFLVGSYPIAQFFGAPLLGTLSDKYGRKKILQISLVGSLLGYLLFGYAILINNLPLMFLSRVVDGFTGGNISVVYSAVSDVSDAQSRTKSFGLIGMALGLGFILGPMSGGILSNSELVGWFDMATPFWAAALICSLNFLLVTFDFKETFQPSAQAQVHLLAAFRNLREVFHLPDLKALLIARFFLMFGFAFFTQYFSAFLVRKFGFGPPEIGWLFAWVGLWVVFAQGGLTRILARVLPPESIVRITAITLGVTLIFAILPDKAWLLYLISPFIAISQGTLTPNITGIISFQASREQQGKIMGINQSVMSLGQALPPFVGGWLSSMNASFPTVAAAVLVLTGAGVFIIYFKEKKGPL
ncbi:MAG: MFS transporter [Bacteroidia bacterium]|nr:MFS transporter [Bacteroidia bacterium]